MCTRCGLIIAFITCEDNLGLLLQGLCTRYGLMFSLITCKIFKTLVAGVFVQVMIALYKIWIYGFFDYLQEI